MIFSKAGSVRVSPSVQTASFNLSSCGLPSAAELGETHSKFPNVF